mmetsp:Transcript_14956/g.58599  ORF Transcript_14956/g.58599 Transcript_14956/m.58599 type:complete len:262 (-) Transcript_14956:418-1203(-)
MVQVHQATQRMRQQRLGAQGLCPLAVGPLAQHRRVEGTQQHDAPRARWTGLRQCGEQFTAVHVGQHPVDDQQVMGLADRCCAQPGQRLGTLAEHLDARGRRQRLHQAQQCRMAGAVGRLHDHDAAQRLHRRHRQGLAARQRQPQLELAAAAGRAAGRQLAAHALNKRPADGQAHAGAAKAPRRAGLQLPEWREQARQLLGGDADAAVPHPQPPGAVVVQSRRQPHLAGRRELDRVDQQFGDQLGQPSRVAAAGTRGSEQLR